MNTELFVDRFFACVTTSLPSLMLVGIAVLYYAIWVFLFKSVLDKLRDYKYLCGVVLAVVLVLYTLAGAVALSCVVS